VAADAARLAANGAAVVAAASAAVATAAIAAAAAPAPASTYDTTVAIAADARFAFGFLSAALGAGGTFAVAVSDGAGRRGCRGKHRRGTRAPTLAAGGPPRQEADGLKPFWQRSPNYCSRFCGDQKLSVTAPGREKAESSKTGVTTTLSVGPNRPKRSPVRQM